LGATNPSIEERWNQPKDHQEALGRPARRIGISLGHRTERLSPGAGAEAEDVRSNPGEDCPGKEGSRIAIGQTAGGRYLHIIYVPDPDPDSVFVITGYELKGNPLTAYRRRRRKREGR